MKGRAVVRKRELLALTGTDHEAEHDECCRLATAAKQMTPAAECMGCEWAGRVRENEREHVLSAMERLADNAVLQGAFVVLRAALQPTDEGVLL